VGELKLSQPTMACGWRNKHTTHSNKGQLIFFWICVSSSTRVPTAGLLHLVSTWCSAFPRTHEPKLELFFCFAPFVYKVAVTMRARRIGEYVMTEAKQERLREIAQRERDRRDREAATSLARESLTISQLAESPSQREDEPTSNTTNRLRSNPHSSHPPHSH